MTKRMVLHLKWWHLSALLVLALAAGIFANAVSAAGRLTDIPGRQVSQVNTNPLTGSGNSNLKTNRNAPDAVDASVFLTTSATAGNCPAPSNGGTTQVGCRFVLDMFINAGSNAAPDGLTAQQSYMTFTYQTIQNARTVGIATSCVPTNTVTADLTVTDAALQNEVCDGPAPCNFRGTITDPGSFAYASGALSNCPAGCPDPSQPPPQDQPIFRIASIGVCAVAPGQAGFFWQFANNPPNDRCANGAPLTRDTELVSFSGTLVQDCTRFVNYTFTVTGPTSTPSNTNTPGAATNTPTNTNTVTVAATNTRTITPSSTNTATNTAVRTNTSTSTTVANTSTRTSTPTSTSAITVTPIRTITPSRGGFIFLTPDTTTVGNCPAPPNGGTTQVGCRFVLDLFVNAGANVAPDGLTAQQSYMTFTYQTIQNARVAGIATSCVPTNTVTGDLSVFDAALQNEVCDGPAPCNFRGSIVDPGSFAYASGALSNCPMGCPDPSQPPPQDQPIFRVAQVGVCAVAPGQATFYWQFANNPPNDRCANGAPLTRDTELVSFSGTLVQDCTLFTNYTFTVTGAGFTPDPTVTSSSTIIATNTSTRTLTPVSTNTNTATTAATNTNTATTAATNTSTRTLTPVSTNTNTATTAATNTNTSTSVSTNTSTRTFTPVSTNTNTATTAATNTNTATTAPSNTSTSTSVSTNTNTRTLTPVSTNTNTATTAATNTNTATTVPSNTNTSTVVPSTSTSTSTAVAATSTRTPTPGVTGTPCDRCRADVKDVDLNCNPDGTLHFSAIIKNDGQCTLTVPYRVTLQARSRPPRPRWSDVQTQRGSVTIPPHSEVVVFGDFCYPGVASADKLRAEFALDGSTHECMKKKKSHEIRTCGNTPTCQLRFPDVPVSNPYYPSVSGLVSNGVITGYGDGTFRPDASVNRGQLAKMIVLAYELTNTGQATTQHFSDVPANNPYYSYVETAYSQGVISGYADGSFHPYSNVTRAQLAKMVVQALGLQLTNPAKASFTDVATNSTFYPYIETANANGLLTGDEGGAFKPGALVSRGEAAQVLDQAR